MHSNRMRTARSLTISRSIRWRGGGAVCPNPLDADSPWTEEMTHACENITLPQTSFAGDNN